MKRMRPSSGYLPEIDMLLERKFAEHNQIACRILAHDAGSKRRMLADGRQHRAFLDPAENLHLCTNVDELFWCDRLLMHGRPPLLKRPRSDLPNGVNNSDACLATST